MAPAHPGTRRLLVPSFAAAPTERGHVELLVGGLVAYPDDHIELPEAVTLVEEVLTQRD